MHCPVCHADDTKVVDSRLAAEGSAVRRRRRCPTCGHRFTTFERVDEVPLTVIKSNGTVEPFDRSKVVRGLLAATKGRHVSDEQIDQIAEAVEDSVRLRAGADRSARSLRHDSVGPAPQSRQGDRNAWSPRLSARLHSGSESTSAQIGVLVLELLGPVDEVAYLRFASVYKNFDAAADFHREIDLLGKLGTPHA